MVEVVDDGVRQVISVVEGYPIAELLDWFIPTKVRKGASFRVEYTVKNTGKSGKVFAYIKLNGAIVPGSKWKLDFAEGYEMDCSFTFDKGIDKDGAILIEVGHEE